MNKEENQGQLFNTEEFEKWKPEWKGMPEFKQDDVTSWKRIIVHFETEEDMKTFGKIIGQKLTYKTRSIWFPEAEIGRIAGRMYVDLTDKELDEIEGTEEANTPDDFN